MAELRQNTWTIGEWYDQNVAGTAGNYTTSAGTLFTWGQNSYGTLGYGSGQPYNQPTYATSAPQQIPGTYWKYTKYGYFWGTGTRSDGTIWTWGRPDSGVLGHNNQTQYKSPKQVGSDTDWDVCEAGYESCIALKTNGTMWGWGQAPTHGGGMDEAQSSPIQIGSGSDWALPIGNGNVMMGVKTNGTLWAWGANQCGGLGQNDRTPSQTPVQIPGTTWSTDINKWANRTHLSEEQITAVKTDGTLWVWGGNTYGQLGLNQGHYAAFNYARSSPTQLPGTTWKNCGGGGTWNMATKTDGTLWIWGTNDGGSLGKELPANGHRSSPVQIPGTTWNVCSSGSGQGNACVRTDGTMWAWGYNTDGQLGISNKSPQDSPVQVPGTDWSDKPIIGGSTFARKAL